MAVDLTSILPQYAAYFLDVGQNKQNLQKEILFKGTETQSMFTEVNIDQDVYTDALETSDYWLQQFQTRYRSIGFANYAPFQTILQRYSINADCIPDDLWQTYLGFFDSLNGAKALSPTNYPFVAYWLNEVVLPKIRSNFELFEIYKGIKGVNTPGVATAKGAAMNGLGKLFADAITAGSIVPNVLGALSTTPTIFCQQIEAMVNSLPEQLQLIQMMGGCSLTLYKRFKLGKRQLYNQYYVNDPVVSQNIGSPIAQFEPVQIADSNFYLQPLPSMIGSNRIWFTPKGNIKYVTRRFKMEDTTQVIRNGQNPYQVDFLAQFYMALHISDPRLVILNELA